MSNVEAIIPGYSDAVNGLLPISDSKCLVMAGWDHVPHLTTKAKRELLASTLPYLRDARSKGIPSLGSGAIYPIGEADISIPDFAIPVHWPRAYGFDVGWNATAVVWGALDRDNDTWYLYSCYKRGHAEPAVHAATIKSRGEWIKGTIDPAARGRNQKDGTKLIEEYESAGLSIFPADNAVEAGIYAVYTRLTENRIKVFRSLAPWFDEYRIYRRDENGKIVKKHDHIMDATRYLIMTGEEIASFEKQVKQSWRDKLRGKLNRPKGGMSA